MVMSQAHTTHLLRYRETDAPVYPGWYGVVGIVSVVVGLIALPVNAFVALAMLGQLHKQWVGRGASRKPIEPWLMVTSAEAVVGMTLAVFAVVAGVVMLRNPGAGASLHRYYAWAKLPFACVFAWCAGQYVVFYAPREAQAVGAAAALALIVTASYPVFLLRVLRRKS
jgi:hypothetical protein